MSRRRSTATTHTRPYRFWNPRTKKYEPHRYYRWPGRAHDACLVYTKHCKVGTILELVNHETAKCLGQYVRIAVGIALVLWAGGIQRGR